MDSYPNRRSPTDSAEQAIFASEEDFGIIPVEAQSEGTPVLALGRGGVRETVATGLHRTGMFFAQPEPGVIAECVRAFEMQEHLFSRSACRAQAKQFAPERFRSQFKAFVDKEVEQSSRSRDGEVVQLMPARSYAQVI